MASSRRIATASRYNSNLKVEQILKLIQNDDIFRIVFVGN